VLQPPLPTNWNKWNKRRLPSGLTSMRHAEVTTTTERLPFKQNAAGSSPAGRRRHSSESDRVVSVMTVYAESKRQTNLPAQAVVLDNGQTVRPPVEQMF
jgi:hypothetical protein